MGDLFEQYRNAPAPAQEKRGDLFKQYAGKQVAYERRSFGKPPASVYEKYKEIVRRPGKFERAFQPYVPYFWEIYLDGGAEYSEDGTLYFAVSAEDKEIFPELKRRKVVKLYEREDGFVVEVPTGARRAHKAVLME